MDGSVVRTVEPATEPLDLAIAKGHLKKTGLDVEDDLLAKVYIPAVRRDVEIITQRSLITQTWVWRFNQFPTIGPLRVPHPPLQSVTSVQYVDSDGSTQTWSASEYVVDTYRTPGLIYPAYGFTYPTSRGDRNSVTVTLVAGYGPTAQDVPEDIRHAMLLMLGDADAQREDTRVITEGRIEDLPVASQRLLHPYVLPVFA